MDIFEHIAAAAWEHTRPPLHRLFDLLSPGWEEWDACAPPGDKLPTVALLDRAGQPYRCSACGHSDLWAMTRYGKWRCSGEHEPVMCGNGYIEQIIEVRWDEVIVGNESH